MADEKKQKNKTKKTKNTTSVKLPNARRSIKRQRAMAQGKASFNGWLALGGVILAAAVAAFILFGGINQRKFVETTSGLITGIGEKIASWVHPDDLLINEDGIYIDPDHDGTPGFLEDKNDNATTESDMESTTEEVN